MISEFKFQTDRKTWKIETSVTCSKCSSVMELTKSAPDTGLRVMPMIPPRNSLAVGGVTTCTVEGNRGLQLLSKELDSGD